jgi:hypothetical protein
MAFIMTPEQFEQVVLTIFSDLTPPGAKLNDLEYQQIIDRPQQRYQLLVTGWEGMRRIHEIVAQIDVKDGLVWLQEDNTDYGVADALLRAGIAQDHIVIGFHPLYKRKLTPFATGEAAS